MDKDKAALEAVKCAKSRVANFSEKETLLLISVVEKFKDIIENRKSDTDTNKQKKEAWKKITTMFNSQSGETFRSVEAIKNKYLNCKRLAKKHVGDDKAYVKGTGGGPPKPSSVTNVDMKLQEIMGSQISGFQAEFGADAEGAMTRTSNVNNNFLDDPNTLMLDIDLPNTNVLDKEISIVELPNCSDTADNSCKPSCSLSTQGNLVNSDWTTYTPSSLKKRKAPQLITKANTQKKDSITNKILRWSERKATIADNENNYLQELHELKIRHLQEKHDKEVEEVVERIKEMKEEHQQRLEHWKLKIKMTEEEHKKKMEILELQKDKLRFQ